MNYYLIFSRLTSLIGFPWAVTKVLKSMIPKCHMVLRLARVLSIFTWYKAICHLCLGEAFFMTSLDDWFSFSFLLPFFFQSLSHFLSPSLIKKTCLLKMKFSASVNSTKARKP